MALERALLMAVLCVVALEHLWVFGLEARLAFESVRL